MKILDAAKSDFDVGQLEAYLNKHISGFGNLTSIRRFDAGQSNPTYKIETESGQYVLRRQPFGKLLASAHAVDREVRVLAALADTSVPVAKVFHLCEDAEIIGASFYVMEFVNGTVFWDPLLPEVTAETRTRIYDNMNGTLAALHSLTPTRLGLTDFGKDGDYFERQIDRWSRQYRASETRAIPAMEQLIRWLNANKVPDDGRVCLVHGDYRLDNLMINADTGDVMALMDWELSTLGHPFSDLAYQCMQWRLPVGKLERGLADVDRKAHGIPTEEEYVSRYCDRSGIDRIDNWNFYLAFSFFRLAAILQGVMKRAASGNASSKEAHHMGAMTEPLAQQAMDLVT